LRPRLRHLTPLLALGAAACLEPGQTPLGVDVLEIPIPEDARILIVDDPALLQLTVEPWGEAPIALAAPEMLFCGYDSVMGALAEPVWVFDAGALDVDSADVEEAFLRLKLPNPDLISSNPEDDQHLIIPGDNPDLAKGADVRLWRLPASPDPALPLVSPLDLGGAEQVPIFQNGVASLEPVHLSLPGIVTLRIDEEMAKRWIGAGDTVAMAMEVASPYEGQGLVRLFAQASSAIDSVASEPARFGVQLDGGDATIAAMDELQAVGRWQAPPYLAERLIVSTGLPRSSRLHLALPDSLRSNELLVMRASLLLCPREYRAVAPWERADNIVSGLPIDEGGLALKVAAALPDAFPADPEDLDDATILKNRLSLFTLYTGSTSIDYYSTVPLDTLRVPITRYVQDWANGDNENPGIDLILGGQDDRLRQLEWELTPADPARRPRLEIVYARGAGYE
jgi:hypothetical protein